MSIAREAGQRVTGDRLDLVRVSLQPGLNRQLNSSLLRGQGPGPGWQEAAPVATQDEAQRHGSPQPGIAPTRPPAPPFNTRQEPPSCHSAESGSKTKA